MITNEIDLFRNPSQSSGESVGNSSVSEERNKNDSYLYEQADKLLLHFDLDNIYNPPSPMNCNLCGLFAGELIVQDSPLNDLFALLPF